MSLITQRDCQTSTKYFHWIVSEPQEFIINPWFKHNIVEEKVLRISSYTFYIPVWRLHLWYEGLWRSRSLPQHHQAKAGYILDMSTVHHRANLYTHTNIHTHIHIYRHFKVTIKPNLLACCLFIDRGRKLKYLERSHVDTVRACKLHTERPWSENQTEEILAVKRQR